jgi:hypothetical protein
VGAKDKSRETRRRPVASMQLRVKLRASEASQTRYSSSRANIVVRKSQLKKSQLLSPLELGQTQRVGWSRKDQAGRKPHVFSGLLFF